MSYCQKFVARFAGNKLIFSLAAAFVTLSGRTADHANFSGEWKLNEAKSEIAQFTQWCIFGGGDRMRSKEMKIAGQADFITVEVASLSARGAPVTIQEKLTFNDAKTESTFVGSPRKKSIAKWSDDGQSITVNSVKNLDINGRKETEIKVTEVWKLTNDGKSLSLQINTKTSSGSEYAMKLVYDKAS